LNWLLPALHQGSAALTLSAALGPLLATIFIPKKPLTANQKFLAGLPVGTKAIWIVDMTASAPQPYVPNLVNLASPVTANLIRGGANQSGVYWTGVPGATLTDFQVGPDGSTTNATRVVAAGNFSYAYQISGWIAGTYTLFFEARTRAGSNQFFKSSFATGAAQGSTQTVTASWQTFSFSGPLMSTGEVFPLRSYDGATGADIDIANVRLFPGTADLGVGSPAGHMLIGASQTELVPTVSAGVMDMSSGGVAIIDFPSALTLNNVTVIAIGKKVVAGAGSGYQAFFSKAGNSGDTQPYGEFGAYFEASSLARDLRCQNLTNPSVLGMWEFNGTGWHTFIVSDKRRQRNAGCRRHHRRTIGQPRRFDGIRIPGGMRQQSHLFIYHEVSNSRARCLDASALQLGNRYGPDGADGSREREVFDHDLADRTVLLR
jgi:hypothetical protein